jgi:chromosome segregation ATPase
MMADNVENGSQGPLEHLQDLEAQLAEAQSDRRYANRAVVIGERVHEARCAYREERRAELIEELEAATGAARSVVRAVVELERQGAGLVDQMEQAISRIRTAETEYRQIAGQSPGLFPNLGQELRAALIEDPDGRTRGLGMVVARLWSGRPLIGVENPQAGVDRVNGKARQF